MTMLALVLLLQFAAYPPLPDSTFHLPTGAKAPLQTCTVAGLGLSTKVMTQQEAWTEARTKWGRAAWLGYSGRNVMIGFTILGWGMKIEPDPTNCPSQNCFKNTNGSWRSAWNSVLTTECQRRQAK